MKKRPAKRKRKQTTVAFGDPFESPQQRLARRTKAVARFKVVKEQLERLRQAQQAATPILETARPRSRRAWPYVVLALVGALVVLRLFVELVP